MNPSKTLLLSLIPALALATGAARASEYTVTLQDTANASIYPSTSAFAGFYTLQVTDNTSNATQIILAMCDDYLTGISIGSTWQANLFSKADIDSNTLKEGDFVKFPPPAPKYNQAGYLFNIALTASLLDQRDINAAIWNLMGAGPAMNANSQSYYNDAIANGSSFDYANVMQVMTSHTPNVSQEFLIGVVPVPAAAWLFGSALGVLQLARRRAR
ncbi:MAG: VPLPA-CTERM sorting domain-containing protein [Chromatiales bacterium]|nr:VPLPA-CTERM sorting domain-containing protein [Chromatiales bacterium]